ncbi:hypothetical protein HCA69_01835 [Listeria grandensis]|uniref:Serine protease n=1 Tax=Listeria grandensis TaxID=1494963 RepID=A0A7X0Y1U3_9LIST|nr:RICIN domain-containing protein [Listeria grandensis]MBC1935089.1 hypothetical protein [Listeria grandensis]
MMNRKRKIFQCSGTLLLIMAILLFVSPSNTGATITPEEAASAFEGVNLGPSAAAMNIMIAEPTLQSPEKVTRNPERIAGPKVELTSGLSSSLSSSQMGAKILKAYDPLRTDKPDQMDPKTQTKLEVAGLIDDSGNFDWKAFDKLPTIDGSTSTKTSQNILQNDDSTVIDDTTIEPYKYSAQLLLNYDGRMYRASAFSIGHSAFMTNAHAVFKNNEFPTSCTVIPARNNASNPFGMSEVRNIVLSPMYNQTGILGEHDWAIIETADDLSASVGYPAIFHPPTDNVTDLPIAMYGYPASIDGVENNQMFQSIGKILGESPSKLLFNHTAFSSPGHSGSPIYVTNGTSTPALVGINTGTAANNLFVGRRIDAQLVKIIEWYRDGTRKIKEVFKDENLAKSVAQAMNLTVDTEVTREQLANFRGNQPGNLFTASNQNITDLNGMEYLRGIEALELDRNSILELYPLAHLKGLTRLSLKNNAIINLAWLQALDQLKDLSLDGNDTLDEEALNLQPLKKLKALTTLSLNSQVSEEEYIDISPLKDCSKLESLFLDHNEIEDLSPLKDLKQLKQLSLDNNNDIHDISPLKDCSELESLFLNHNEIEDLSPLKDLKQLKQLRLDENHIRDLSPLKNMINSNNNLDYTAKNQVVKLPKGIVGVATEVKLLDRNSITPQTTIKKEDGIYRDNQLIWFKPGKWVMPWISSDNRFSGNVHQIVDLLKASGEFIIRPDSNPDDAVTLQKDELKGNVTTDKYYGTNFQRWRLDYNAEKNAYRIFNVQNPNLVMAWNSSVQGSLNVMVYPDKDTGDDGWWKIDIGADNSCTLTNLKNNDPANKNYVLDLEGSNVQVYPPNNSVAQKWTLEFINEHPLEDGEYTLSTGSNSFFVADVNKVEPYGNVNVWNYHGGANQKWKLVYHPEYNNTYRIHSVQDPNYILVNNNQDVQVYEAERTGDVGYWKIDNSSGKYILRNFAEPNMALDFHRGLPENGADITVQPSHGGDAQKWEIHPIISNPIADGSYSIRSNLDETKAANREATDNVDIMNYIGSDDQLWRFEFVAALAAYRIYIANDKLNMDRASRVGIDTNKVMAWDSAHADNVIVEDAEKTGMEGYWKIEKYIDRYLLWNLKDPSKALTVYNEDPTNGTNLQVYHSDNILNAQLWSLEPEKIVRPEDPRNLRATNVTHNEISLAWDASEENSNVAHHIIKRGGEEVGRIDGETLTFTHLELDHSTDYTYTVSAHDKAGNQLGSSDRITVSTLESPDLERKISDFFPDKNLAKAVALKLTGDSNIDVPITTEELEDLTDLTATNADISNLKGLEFAVNLEKLNVDNNRIDTDGMMPITSLRKLEYLDISANRILNHKPLGDMAGTALSGPGAIKRINAHNQGLGRSLDATNEADRELLGLSLNLDENVLTAKNIVRSKDGRLDFLINSAVAPGVLINGTGYTFSWIDSVAGKFRVDGIPENIHTLTIRSSSGQTKIATGFSITITNLDKIGLRVSTE